MKKIQSLCVVLLALCPFLIDAQALKKGDVVPDMEINNVFNYISNKLKLSDFKKKLIILDFWSTNCSGCIRSFPKMDSLQKTFDKDIQIILINRSDRDSTERFFHLRRKILKPDLPLITTDTVFQNYFPHRGEPYYVLIDSLRRVHFFPDAITFTLIQRYLDGEDIEIGERKKNIYLTSALDERLKGSLNYSSVLIKTTPGLQLTNPNDPEFTDITLNFASVIDLYLKAYNDTLNSFFNAYRRPGRSILEGADKFKYVIPEDPELYDEWQKHYSYSYQLVLPKDSRQNKYEVMKQDLNRCFNLEVKIEKRKVKCLTLIRTSTKDKIKSKGERAKDNLLPAFIMATQIDSVRSYLNKDYKAFSDRLAYIIEYYLKKPFMDATGYNAGKLISIKMSGEALDSFDLEAYKNELMKYDLDLVEQEWLMNVLVLREKK